MVMITMIDDKKVEVFSEMENFDLVRRKVCVKIELTLTKIRPLGFQI